MKKPNKPVPKSTKQKQPDNSFTRKNWFQLAFILLGVFVIYSPSLSKEFINYDDDWYIYDNPFVNPFSFSNIGEIFSEFYFGQYSPLPMTFLGFINLVAGNKPFLYNFFSILLHLVNVTLVCWLVYRLIKKPIPALIVAALFGICTLNVESVAWASAAFKTGFYGVFFLGSLITYTFYLSSNNIKFLFASLGLFILSFLSKEQSVALIFALLCIDFLNQRNLLSKKVILEKLPFLILSIVFGIITIMATKSNRDALTYSNFTFSERILYACYALGEYVMKLFAPYQLSAYYPYPASKNFSFFFYLHPAIIVAFVFLLIRTVKNNKIVAFGILFFIANILFSLVLQVVSVREVVMADRYVYVSSIGIFFIFSMVLQNFIEKNSRFKGVAYSSLLLYLLIISAISFQRTKVWKNTQVLLEDNLKNFTAPLPLVNLGIEYKRHGQIEKAMSNYNRSIELYPEYGLAYLNRGNIYFDAGQRERAMADYDKAEKLGVKTEHLFANRGALFAMKKDYAKAFIDFEKSLQVNPRHANAFMNRGITYFEMRDFKSAIADYTNYLKLKPGDDGIYCDRGVAYQNLNQNEEAVKDFDMAIKLKSGNGFYYLNRSYSYNVLGKKALALNDALTAQSLGEKVNSDYLEQLKRN
ncbi:MAG: tetratricopeptide repeat protein [Bacteroidia bacterium]|nr:tetratricopeptide repeat protein [Bacteroidia bacterium]